jgi:hypothetical protein
MCFGGAALKAPLAHLAANTLWASVLLEPQHFTSLLWEEAVEIM